MFLSSADIITKILSTISLSFKQFESLFESRSGLTFTGPELGPIVCKINEQTTLDGKELRI